MPSDFPNTPTRIRILNFTTRAVIGLIRPFIAISQSTVLFFQKWCGRLRNRYKSGSSRVEYGKWLLSHATVSESMYREITESIALMRHNPVISFVMPVYNPVPEFLDSAIRSVRDQIYPHWELCVADDASTDPRIAGILRRHQAEDSRIKVAFRRTNGHISEASNSALELATGDYIALIDHDDMVPPDALHHAALEIVRHPDAMLIYSDEDKLGTDGKRCDPHFKSGWNLDLFLAHNMINHLGIYRTSVVREIGGFRKGFEGAQDYDLCLRFIEKVRPDQIRHIPRILYHWRMHKNSVSLAPDSKPYSEVASRLAIAEYLQRKGIEADPVSTNCGIRIKYALPSPTPRVTLIVTGSSPVFISNCLRSILEKTRYADFEVLLAGDAATHLPAASLSSSERGRRVRILDVRRRAHSWPALCNLAVERAEGTIVGFIDSRLEVIGDDWLEEMAAHVCRPEIGAVGARLFYMGNKIYHGGVILGMHGGIAGFASRGKRPVGYAGRGALIQSFCAVSGQCLLVRKEAYLETGGFNEALPVMADIDICLRLRQAGYRNIWTPFAELRFLGTGIGLGRKAPDKAEAAYMKDKWGSLIAADPYYNPNLTLDSEDFSLAHTPRTTEFE